MGNTFKRIFLSIAYFLFIYSFSIPGLPKSFITYRVVLILLLVYSLIFLGGKKVKGVFKTNQCVKKYTYFNLYLILYVGIILFLFGQGSGISSFNDYVNMAIVLPLFYYTGRKMFDSLEELMWVLRIVGLVQACIIFLGILIPAIHSILLVLNADSAFESREGGLSHMVETGYHIGFHCFTSKGSLQLLLSQFACVYYIIKKGRLYNYLIFLVISVASTMVARTGLVITIVCLINIIYIEIRCRHKTTFLYYSLGVSFLLALIPLLLDNFSYTSFYQENFIRLNSLFNRGFKDGYLDAYIGVSGENIIPPISIYTIMGTGVVSGTSGAGVTGSMDGGFLRNYFAMGLINTLILYYLLYSCYKKHKKVLSSKENKSLMTLLLILFIIGETKEYFLYEIYFICFVFLIFFFFEKEKQENKKSTMASLYNTHNSHITTNPVEK